LHKERLCKLKYLKYSNLLIAGSRHNSVLFILPNHRANATLILILYSNVSLA
jgi:hypothetical protein